MSGQLIKVALIALLSLTVSLSKHQTNAKPAAPFGVRRSDRTPPNLDDTLAVAKSPLEPVTLALTLPDVARTNEQPLETTRLLVESDFSTSLPELVVATASEDKRTTRSAQTFVEQQSSSTTKGLEEGTGLGGGGGGEPGGTTQSVATEASEEPTGATDTPTESNTEAVTRAADNEPTTTTTPEPASSESSSTGQESTTTTPEPETPAATTVTNATTTSTTVAEEQTTTTTTKEPETTTTEATTTTLAPTTTTTLAPTTTEAPTTTTTTTTTEPPATTVEETTASSSSTGDDKTDLKEIEKPKEVTPEPTTTTTTTSTTTTTIAPTSGPTVTSTEVSSTAEIEREQPLVSSTQTPTVSTSTAAPVPSPSSETQALNNSTTATPVAVDDPKQKERLPCNHLPTYDSEEIQKVFREETTFKNGTIKGEFTYINFDQRYRLVHYTRLPYGPVKIDRVEELGKPKQDANNQTAAAAAPSLSEIPNAVLQLRNLLPNSLFGFPFLGPNTGARAQSPFVGPKENVGGVHGNDESNMYFYSTDSLSTPNLFNPKVPVSLLPGQRIKAGPTSSSSSAQPSPMANQAQPADSQNGFYGASPMVALTGPAASSGRQQQQHLAFGMPNPQDDYSKQLNRLDELVAPTPVRPHDNGQPASRQFQYSSPFTQTQSTSLSSSTSSLAPSSDKGLVFSYYTSHAHPAHHSYIPSAYQPYPLRVFHHQYQPQPMMAPSMEPLVQHHDQSHAQAHQPHSHEHYMAPFMFAKPAEQRQSHLGAPASAVATSDTGNNNDGSRLRLMVKTSKSLNINQMNGRTGTKSAQLRMQPSDGHYSQLDSPAKLHHRNQQQRQQQRLGKQNHQLLRSSPTTNQSPVVYHVLRKPYNQQYDQGYAVAYDHDN